MRSIILFLFTLLFVSLKAQHTSAPYSNLSRNISVNITNQPLSTVLNKISTAGNFYFSYSGDVLKSDTVVSLSVQNQSVKAALTQLFKDEVQYKESGKYIILRSVSRRFRVIPEVISNTNEEYEIDGYVYDEKTGTRIKDASVYERGLLKTTLTDQEGYFSLRFKGEHKGVLLTISRENFRDTTIRFLSSVTIQSEASNNPDSDEGIINRVERLGLGRFLVTSKQRVQSLNIPSVIANMPFQASLLPGLSSHGMLSSQVVNKGSLNVLGGYTAGVDGVEIAGLFNITKQNVKKVQAAGLINLVGGCVLGVQAAGLFNVVLDSVKGVQAAGLFNTVNNKVHGVQAAGLANIVRQNSKGGQFAGLVNIGFENLDGVQAAGLINVSGKSTTGGQAAGLINFSGKSTSGIQVSGLGNITLKDLKGVQVSGLFNFAKRMYGTQIALINIADTSSGYSIGLLNLVWKGYHKVSLSTNEVLNANLSLKTGNSKLYTMLMGGANLSDSEKAYSTGLGLGHDFLLNKKFSISAELSSQFLFLGRKNETNILNKAQVNAQVQLVKGLTLFAGPSYSVYYSDAVAIARNGYKSRIGPQKRKSFNNTTFAWRGFNFGIMLM